MRPEEFIVEQKAPFIQKEFIAKTQLSPEEAKAWLTRMVTEQILGFRKIGRMKVYWAVTEMQPSVDTAKPSTEERELPKKLTKDKKTTLTDYLPETEPATEKVPEKKAKPVDDITKLYDRIHELEEERDLYLGESQRAKHELERFQARFSDEEDVWREVAEKMAASLAEMRGVTIKEVLKYFDAPHY
jgi:FtsZ-binding cell division protein ZapB